MPPNVLPEASEKKYINRDLADEVLKSFQVHILPGYKLIYDDVDVMDHAHSIMNVMKKSEVSKSPLPISIVDIHNTECLKYLSQGFKKYIVDQMQDNEVDALHFSKGKYINKIFSKLRRGSLT
ncbi:6234_t:CDS:1, partial [Diversispora eburnea]